MKPFKSIKKRIFTFVLLLLLCLSVQALTEHTWIRTNPGGGGAFNCIKAGPTGIIIAGSDLSGAYMSKDHGVSFTSIGALQGLASDHVMSVGFDPIDPKKFFIGTESYLQMTTDGGLTFSKSISLGSFNDIVISKSNPLFVYAARHTVWNTSDGAIYRSTDGGFTFSNMSGNTGMRILKLILDPNDNQIIYYVTGTSYGASSIARLYRSVDGGVTSSDITGGKGNVMDADIDPVTTSTIYMTTYSAFPGGNFYKSTDNGSTWSSPIAHPGGIFVKQDEPNRIRVIEPRAPATWNAGSGTWESTNRGTAWTKTGIITIGWETAYNKDITSANDQTQGWDVFRSYGTTFQGIVKCFGTDMSDPNVILWCNSQFLYRSSDGGVTFKNIFTNEVSPGWWQSRGVDNVNMTDMAISEVNPNLIYIGYFDMGFWRSLDGGKSWQSSNDLPYTGGWNGYGGNVMSIVADPLREAVVWTTMSANQMGQSPTYLLKSTSSGERGSWKLVNNGLPTTEVMGLSLDRLSNSNSRTMYVTAQGYVYKSINDGANWTKMTTGLPTNGGLRFTAVDNFDGNIVYAGGGTGLYASTDAGANWSMIGNLDQDRGGSVDFWGSSGRGVFDIEPDPQTGGTVYVTVYGFGKGLYRGVKSDGAIWTWTKLCTDNFMRKVCVNPLNTNYVYATSSSAFTDGSYDSSSNGVYFSNDKFATYSIVNNGMAWPFAMNVKCDKLNNVYVGSPGTGFQKSAIPLSTGVEDLTNKGNILIYSNPTNDYINILNIPKITGKYIIEVRNMLGQKVLTYPKLTSQIEVSTLKNGEYILSIIGYNINYSHKFIKQ
jgi:photosystem II stability/assembly factor-like uncharacterized protein